MPAGQDGGGQWVGDNATVSGEAVTGRVLFAADITGFTGHGINQAINRSISPSKILDATQNPLKVENRSNGSIRYFGRGATVVLNPAGQVITIWPDSLKSVMSQMSRPALLKAISRLLWEHWDPIDLHDTDAPNNEYDEIAAAVAELIVEGSSEHDIAKRMAKFVDEDLGIVLDEAKTISAAKLIFASM